EPKVVSSMVTPRRQVVLERHPEAIDLDTQTSPKKDNVENKTSTPPSPIVKNGEPVFPYSPPETTSEAILDVAGASVDESASLTADAHAAKDNSGKSSSSSLVVIMLLVALVIAMGVFYFLIAE